MTVMADLSDLPMLHDIDADCTPQYVKLARVLREEIESGKYHRGDILPAADLAREHNASIRVTYAALAMLAANRYVDRPGAFTAYSVIWQTATRCEDGAVASMAGSGPRRSGPGYAVDAGQSAGWSVRCPGRHA